jgi:hypothetical protein
MTDRDSAPVSIGILWRGDRTDESPAPRADRQLGHLYEALTKLRVRIVPIPYEDDAPNEVREEIHSCDGVLVWVNPIQDGANRSQLDPLLREAHDCGVFVSANPDVILKLGTKEVLFHTRELGWGSDTALYSSLSDFAARFPTRLLQRGKLVLKQGRGNGGIGVWKVQLTAPRDSETLLDRTVRVHDARLKDGTAETMLLGEFVGRCEQYFAWSGCLVDQEYQERLGEGMIRCYFTHDEIVGFVHQWPKGLLEFDPTAPAVETPSSLMEGPDAAQYQSLRVMAETQWVPEMKAVLALEREDLPVIWDADFLYGPKDDTGKDTYVLCEINVSAVWPFPPMASDKIAAATLARTMAARASRSHR